jgi:hypothetical protein
MVIPSVPVFNLDSFQMPAQKNNKKFNDNNLWMLQIQMIMLSTKACDWKLYM